MKQKGYWPSNKIKAFLSIFIFVRILPESKKIIVDSKLLERSGLKFIDVSARELGFRFSIEYYNPKYEKGIALADFVAGYAKVPKKQ